MGEGNPPEKRSTSGWAEWAKPRRWLSFAQRIFTAEHELRTLRERVDDHDMRIRNLERALDRQSGQIDSLDHYIEAKVALEVERRINRLLDRT